MCTTVCVHSKSEGGVGGVSLQFQLHRLDDEEVTRTTVFMGFPRGSNVGVACDDDSDDFEDFSDEYGQVLDEEDGFNFDWS